MNVDYWSWSCRLHYCTAWWFKQKWFKYLWCWRHWIWLCTYGLWKRGLSYQHCFVWNCVLFCFLYEKYQCSADFICFASCTLDIAYTLSTPSYTMVWYVSNLDSAIFLYQNNFIGFLWWCWFQKSKVPFFECIFNGRCEFQGGHHYTKFLLLSGSVFEV